LVGSQREIEEELAVDKENASAPKVREGRITQFIRRNLFRVKLENGVNIDAVMADEVLPKFDPNLQLNFYNWPHVEVEMREPPALPKIISLRRSGGWCGFTPHKFWQEDV
jgi:hypothetical protein